MKTAGRALRPPSAFPDGHILYREKNMRFTALTVLALAALLFAAVPSQAMMDHGTPSAPYSDRAFLSGMIAHHEGAVDMAELFLKTPKKEQDPTVAAWAEDIVTVQQKEIADMKRLLEPLGGMEENAYAPMRRSMRDMLKEGADLGPNRRFVEIMLHHHAMAVEMAVPALLNSNKPAILKLAEEIITVQAKEMFLFRTWLVEREAKK